ncbi:MAG: pilus assembly protein [Pirellulales bacterium]
MNGHPAQPATFKQRQTSCHHRRGTTIVESAIGLSVLLLVLIGSLDVGLATARHDLLSTAARHLAREAAVHGDSASPERTTWGPATLVHTAGDGSEVAAAVAAVLPTMSANDVTVELEWPDGTNETGDRVVVRLSYVHQGAVLLGLGNGLPLKSESTMRITH